MSKFKVGDIVECIDLFGKDYGMGKITEKRGLYYYEVLLYNVPSVCTEEDGFLNFRTEELTLVEESVAGYYKDFFNKIEDRME